MNNHVVIMAGGIGSRFWPMSTPECPKQFIDILGCGKTLIQLTVERFGNVCPQENMWVVTSEKYRDTIREQLPGIPESNILAEPCPRNTAPCIAYACWKIKKKYPEANIVVTPSDQVVIDTTEFRRVIEKALLFTDKSSAIITLGIKPARPETGYGYIAAGEPITRDKEIFHVEAFKEKPDKETAERQLLLECRNIRLECENDHSRNAGICTGDSSDFRPDISRLLYRTRGRKCEEAIPHCRKYLDRLCSDGKSGRDLCITCPNGVVGLRYLGSITHLVAKR